MRNKSPLTVSQALKVYTGTGLAGTILGLAAYECVFYVGAYAAMALVIALSDGTSFLEATANIAETPAADSIMAFASALINCFILLVPHDRNAPGGKLFRTVRGGFGTFTRSRIGIYISAVLAALIFCVFALVLDLGGIAKLQNSIYAEAAAFILTLAALGAGTLALLTVGGVIGLNTLAALNGSALPHIFVGIGGAGLLAIAVKIYLTYYKRNLWDN